MADKSKCIFWVVYTKQIKNFNFWMKRFNYAIVLNLSRFLLLKLLVFQRYMNNVYNWEYISEQSDILICIAFRNTKNGKLCFVCLIGFFSRLFCLCLLLFQTPTVSSSIVIPLPLLLTFHKSWTLRQIRAYLSWHPLCLLHVRTKYYA